MRKAVCEDGRLRGLLQFYGANRTGRWAGRLVQVQNLRTNTLPDLDLARNLIKSKSFEGVELLFGSVPDTLSQLIRTAFIAKPNHRFIVVDFSAIEARVIAWLAACEWRLAVFNGDGRIYEASAEKMFKLPLGSVTKKSPYRQRGKISELALSYGGGAGALKTMGALEMGLSENELEPIKIAWRDANPEIRKFWWDCEAAAIDAVSRRDKSYVKIANRQAELEFSYEKGILFITLPSGRRLAYVAPRLALDEETGRYSLTYQGIHQRTRAWTVLRTYGGKIVENIVQAIARDCLCESMLALDEKNYMQLMTIHDEIVIEAPDGFGSLDEVTQLLASPISWAPGLPLRADGFETKYYQKEVE
jgi:DNA polymerase